MGIEVYDDDYGMVMVITTEENKKMMKEAVEEELKRRKNEPSIGQKMFDFICTLIRYPSLIIKRKK